MLEIDYPSRFSELIQAVDCDIELPIEWANYFDERGEVSANLSDDRNSLRLKIRTHGLMWFERSLPFCPRSSDPVVIYTRDFSRVGAGWLCPFEVYPEESVRIVLPTFWVQLRVARTRRITSKCYEIGGALIERHDPSPDAFVIDSETVCR
ncbi:hypothetical protein K227x_06700 [Rubripirellula lacrimiformis]|uniref:PilZ domain-containing protein n=1 Tax=Rubripirellula lacrimiformis TaxID=1930273 RepID=A0A517N585_9BACT|nr:hypothetical protein [Rubripirellula lacrimiformis]QDT02294.1 hypothetical protein K227x_06700 [Rubripirellula lacrimiformis]